MNFVKHQRTLETLLKTQGQKSYSGLYIFSRDKAEKVYKFGMSVSSLYRRLKQHKQCYPFQDEFFLQFIVVIRDTAGDAAGNEKRVRLLERKLLEATRKQSTVVEKGEAEGDGKQGQGPEQGQRPVEYRVFANRNNLNKILKEALLNNRSMWDYLIVFGENGWDILPNKETLKHPIRTIKSLTKRNPRLKQRPKLTSLPLNNSYVQIPRTVKVGDWIDSDNWEKMKVLKIVSPTKLVVYFRGDKKKTEYVVTGVRL